MTQLCLFLFHAHTIKYRPAASYIVSFWRILALDGARSATQRAQNRSAHGRLIVPATAILAQRQISASQHASPVNIEFRRGWPLTVRHNLSLLAWHGLARHHSSGHNHIHFYTIIIVHHSIHVIHMRDGTARLAPQLYSSHSFRVWD